MQRNQNKFSNHSQNAALEDQLMREMEFFQSEREKHSHSPDRHVDALLDWAKALPDDIELSGSKHQWAPHN